MHLTLLSVKHGIETLLLFQQKRSSILWLHCEKIVFHQFYGSTRAVPLVAVYSFLFINMFKSNAFWINVNQLFQHMISITWTVMLSKVITGFAMASFVFSQLPFLLCKFKIASFFLILKHRNYISFKTYKKSYCKSIISFLDSYKLILVISLVLWSSLAFCIILKHS